MNTEALLKKNLNEIGISISEKQMQSFMCFLAELKKWNKTYNLTAIKKDSEIVTKHFIDSLLYLRTIPSGTLNLADTGTGAGFPGIPIKIVRPEIDLTLIEPTRKKASFLRHCVRQLELSSINIVEQRLENLGNEHEGAYDYMVSRAAFSIKEFVDMGCPYLRKGGRLVISKGPGIFDELEEALENAPYIRQHVKELHRLQLPFSTAERNLLVMQCKN